MSCYHVTLPGVFPSLHDASCKTLPSVAFVLPLRFIAAEQVETLAAFV